MYIRSALTAYGYFTSYTFVAALLCVLVRFKKYIDIIVADLET